MQYTMAGIILFTKNHAACVQFYGDVLGLKVLHCIDRPKEQLTTFQLGDTYLMVESDGTASHGVKTPAQTPIKLRFNVPNVVATADALRRRGVDVSVVTHSWGTTAEFSDLDGNPCALRSDDGVGV